jgi:hypothetical protein
VAPDEVRMSATYCRVDVDLARAGAAARTEGSDPLPVNGSELVIAARPLKGDPHDYGDGKPLSVEDKAEHRLLESRWQRYAEGRGQQGRSIEVRFRETKDDLLSAIVCFRKGAEYPGADDVARALGGLASIEAAVDDSAARAEDAARERRDAETLAKTVGQSAPVAPRQDAVETPKDRLKEYQESLKARKVTKREPSELDDAITDVPAAPQASDGASRGAASTLGGIDWGEEMAKADATRSKKGDDRSKAAPKSGGRGRLTIQ